MSNLNHPRLLSFTLDEWAVLGGRVTLNLTDGVVVLVGRNGVGKSAILEGLDAISSFTTGRFRRTLHDDYENIPKVLEILITTPTNRQLRYKYELIPALVDNDDMNKDDPDSSYLGKNLMSWNDCCQYADGQEETIWITEAGETTFGDSAGGSPFILGNNSPFALIRSRSRNIRKRLLATTEMEWIFDVLWKIHILGKDPVRRTSRRRPSFFGISGGIDTFYTGGLGFDLPARLTKKILRRMETGGLDELESVCQRVGIGEKITVKKTFLSQETGINNEKKGEEYVSSVLLDGINIGLLSDGTLRVLYILIEIIDSSPTATTIIEEPEMQIHPGMLSNLLAEIETYTFGENLIIATHSPQVVSWAGPEKIRLVYRSDGQTVVRQLYEDEIQKVVEYLCEEGDLGDWIYSGALDE